MMPTAADVAAFLGRGDDPETVALAGQVLPIVTAMARAYTRDRGFVGPEPTEDVAAVLVTATARLMANPEQIRKTETVGPFSHQVDTGFTGWTLAELFVLNRYRVRHL
ncbi:MULTISPECIES: hypothetical protein [unclassified Luteococcus]|uniref:hypothetical protein n=1 Tax=unclassified Luteococcus TaxID=2639923 RepID=UPI00313CB8C1